MTNDTPTIGDDFVGRERELGELRAALAAATAKRGRVVLITGDPGIGKTRLAEEIAADAARLGAVVHWGRCREGGGVPAFWPWIQIARSLLGEEGATRPSAGSGAEVEALARLAPELAAGGGTAQPSASAGSESERFRFFDGLTSFLARAAATAPRLLVLDDLHAADDGSLLLLDFAARHLTAIPVLVVATYREPEARAEPRRAEILAGLPRFGMHLPLGGLSRAEVGRLIARVLAETPTEGLVSAVHELTEGNPFFVDEVVRLLSARAPEDNGELGAGGLAIPSTVRDVVRERLRLLSAECRGVLEIAAVIGRDVDLTLLSEVAAVDPIHLLDLWAEGATLGAVRPPAGNRGAFGHAILRETIYGDLRPSVRVALHRRVGEALEHRHAEGLEQRLADLAHHCSRGAAPQAVDYAERAAAHALDLLAYEDAARLYALALETLPLLEAAEARGERSLRLLLRLGHAQVRAGDAAGARATFERAAAAARARNAGEPFARAALGCGGVGLGVPSGTVDRDLVAILEEALARDTGPELRARVLARLALELYFSDSAARRLALMDEAWALAGGLDDETRAHVMLARLVGLWDLTPPARRLSWCDALVELAGKLGDGELALRAHSYRLLEIIDGGEVERWGPELEMVASLAERLREPRFLGMSTGTRAMRSLWLGRFSEAEALWQKALDQAQPIRDPQTAISVTVQTFVARRLQGRLEEVETAARASVEIFPDVPGARCMLALHLCDLGRFDEARTHIEYLGGPTFERIRSQNRIGSLLPWLAEAAVLLRDTARGEVLYRDLLPFAGRNVSLQTRLCFGPAAHYLGMLAALLGRPDEAGRWLDDALAEARRMDGQPLVALIQLERARLALSIGEAALAREVLADARRISAGLGMGGVLASIAALEEELTPSSPAAVEAPEAGGKGTPARKATLRRDGPLWTVATEDLVLRCKDGKGLRYIAHLIRQPGRALHVVELEALEDRSAPAESSLAGMSDAQLERLGMRVSRGEAAEPASDAQAVRQYRLRLEELRDELDEAERFNDAGRSSRLRDEREVLTHSLAAATGLGGRLRPTGSHAERARINVTRAIRTVMARITEGHPEIGAHLERSIRTGSFCRYAPDAADRLLWVL